MSFSAYMLHCRGGYFYVGQTDDLEYRLAQHIEGAIPGFTADHLPVELVWPDEFLTRDEAKDAERQIKGWSRAKKLALIRGDWKRISELAKSKNSPSTGSGRTGKGGQAPIPAHSEVAGSEAGAERQRLSFSLLPHPHHPPSGVRTITARVIGLDANWLRLRWRVEGAEKLIVPRFAGKGRADRLWRTTCFEAFLRPVGGEAYVELNLSPSERWNAYDLARYREGMAERPFPREPQCTLRKGERLAIFDAAIPAVGLPPLPSEMGLSAVIEEEGGVVSYWALAHPERAPDFHGPACFAATLEPPGSG